MNSEILKYTEMQKAQYSKVDPIVAVGNYEWHQEFPYEQNLLYINGDTTKPLVSKFDKALDFGCGTGRMVERMSKLFSVVEGVDISENMLNYAKKHLSNTFYLSSGFDIGEAGNNEYDLIYSTIAIQHIPCRTIRNMIFKAMREALNEDGVVSLQLAYREDCNYKDSHSFYNEDNYDAKGTNSMCDVIINPCSVNDLVIDFNEYFKEVNYHLVRVNDKYNNLNGKRHSQYWASHWLFIYGKSK